MDSESEFSDIPWDQSSDSESDEKSNEKPSLKRQPSVTPNNCRVWSDDEVVYPRKPYKKERGATHGLPSDASEKDFLDLFMGEDFYEHIVSETNKYAEFKQKKMGKVDTSWYPVTVPEIEAFIGILIYMGIVKLPSVKMYFFSKLVTCDIVRQAMTYRRFIDINKYFHLADEEKAPDRKSDDYDVLYNVRPVIDVTKQFPAVFQLHCVSWHCGRRSYDRF